MTKRQSFYICFGLLSLVWLIIAGFKVSIQSVETKIENLTPQEITITMYTLSSNGDNLGDLCQVDDPTTPQDETDTHYGCVAMEENPDLFYPYPSNPATISLDDDYLLDVVPREMGPAAFTLPALQNQAIAARSYALCAINAWAEDDQDGTDYWAGCLRKINNSNQFQVFTPGYFELLTAEQQQLIQAAVATGGYLIAPQFPEEGPIFAEFSADAYAHTADGGNYPFLRGVPDPISTTCYATNYGHGHGLSQKGVNRWFRGNQCATLNEGDQPWSVQWTDYRLGFAHYYLESQLVDAQGNPLAPANRWNPFSHNILPQMEADQLYTITFVLQNTSVEAWGTDIVFGYRWTAPGDSPYTPQGNWQIITTDLTLVAGAVTTQTFSIQPPTSPGDYALHLDVAHQGEGLTWFGAPNNPAYNPWPHWISLVSIISNATPTPTVTTTPSATTTPLATATPQPTPSPTSPPTNPPPPSPTPQPPTATPNPQPCVAQVILKDVPFDEQSDSLTKLYLFRDTFLHEEVAGQAYIDLYYRHSPELATLLLKNPILHAQSRILFDQLWPFILPLTDASAPPTALTQHDIDDLDAFLLSLKREASPALASEIEWWRRQLPGWLGLTAPQIWKDLHQ